MTAKYALEWIRKAENDRIAAERALKDSKKRCGQAEIACFHTEQCVQKYLKAFLAKKKCFVPKTHDLIKLKKQCDKATGSFLSLFENDLRFLNEYSVDIRYPGATAEPEEARKAVRCMKKIRKAIRSALKIGARVSI